MSSGSETVSVCSVRGLFQSRLMLQTRNAVSFIDKHDFRLISGDLFFDHWRICTNDHQIAQMRQSCCRTIERYLTAAALSTNCISREALAIIDVVKLDFFKLADIGRVQQIFINPARTLVIEVALRDRRPMDFRAQHDTLHSILYLRMISPPVHISVAATISSLRSIANAPSLSIMSLRKSRTLRA